MIFELMSNGSAASLPQTALPEGIPEISGPGVILLLPYNRYLLGHCFMHNYERWIWGKPGADPREIFLYESGPRSLIVDDSTRVTLSAPVISQIRAALLSQMPPPGEHQPTLLMLRGVLKDHPAFRDESLLQSEPPFFQYAEKDGLLNMTYWAVRFALFRGDLETIVRIKTWLRTAADLFDVNDNSLGHVPKIWFSLTALPGRRELTELESLSFSVDDLQRMVSQSALPVVLFSKAGYLVLSDFGAAGGTTFRVWVFLPAPLWNELRERRKLSIRDLVVSAWGYCDAALALAERSRYAPSSRPASGSFAAGYLGALK